MPHVHKTRFGTNIRQEQRSELHTHTHTEITRTNLLQLIGEHQSFCQFFLWVTKAVTDTIDSTRGWIIEVALRRQLRATCDKSRTKPTRNATITSITSNTTRDKSSRSSSKLCKRPNSIPTREFWAKLQRFANHDFSPTQRPMRTTLHIPLEQNFLSHVPVPVNSANRQRQNATKGELPVFPSEHGRERTISGRRAPSNTPQHVPQSRSPEWCIATNWTQLNVKWTPINQGLW